MELYDLKFKKSPKKIHEHTSDLFDTLGELDSDLVSLTTAFFNEERDRPFNPNRLFDSHVESIYVQYGKSMIIMKYLLDSANIDQQGFYDYIGNVKKNQGIMGMESETFEDLKAIMQYLNIMENKNAKGYPAMSNKFEQIPISNTVLEQTKLFNFDIITDILKANKVFLLKSDKTEGQALIIEATLGLIRFASLLKINIKTAIETIYDEYSPVQE